MKANGRFRLESEGRQWDDYADVVLSGQGVLV